MKLSGILAGVDMIERPEPDSVEITGLAVDSRRVSPGTLFIAVTGHTADGHDFIDEALKNGASAIVAERRLETSVPMAIVKDSGAAEPVIARNYFQAPDARLLLTGITGTNGKTSTAFLLQAILDETAGPAGIIGTVGSGIRGSIERADQTTPGPVNLFGLLAGFVESGCRSAVMEVSSHAAVQGRVAGIEFDVGVFTNITRDHLDYHETFEKYIEAKEIFVGSLTSAGRVKRNGTLVYNMDDARVREVAARFGGEKISFGLGDGADIRAVKPEAGLDGTRFGLSTPDGDLDVELKLLGRFSIYNALAAAGAACALSLPVAGIKAGLETVDSVPGRFQVIRSDRGPIVVVDYAHTPDALESLLSFCRELGPRELITVFGCGGDRDRGKRPQMGRIAAQLSDRVYVTNDNPRTEDPGSIIDEIFSGIEDGTGSAVRLEERAEAISAALSSAGEGDLVVIAGKGHEDYQILGKRKIHFSDTEQAIKVLHDLEVRYQD